MDLDLNSHTPINEMALRLGMAALFGMVIGIDREWRRKSAGLRTHMLVSLSSATTTLVALEILYNLLEQGHTEVDPLRVVQGLAQAIGFISAGVIIQSRGDVRGVTTAVNIWLCSAIGVASGAGHYALAGLALGFTMVVLTGMHFVEKWLFGQRREDKED